MTTTDKKNKLWIILIAIVAVAGIVILTMYNLKKERETYFNKIELVNSSIVTNRTDMKYLDTIIKVGLDELNINNVVIIIRNMPRNIDVDGISYKAIIHAGKSSLNQYLIEIDESNKAGIIQRLSHELIHLKQYHTKKLTVEKDYIIWKGDTIHRVVPYEDREWEIEAVELGRVLEIQIRSILYK